MSSLAILASEAILFMSLDGVSSNLPADLQTWKLACRMPGTLTSMRWVRHTGTGTFDEEPVLHLLIPPVYESIDKLESSRRQMMMPPRSVRDQIYRSIENYMDHMQQHDDATEA